MKNHIVIGAGLIDDFIRNILSIPFCPCHFVQCNFVRIPFCPYHFVRTILSAYWNSSLVHVEPFQSLTLTCLTPFIRRLLSHWTSIQCSVASVLSSSFNHFVRASTTLIAF